MSFNIQPMTPTQERIAKPSEEKAPEQIQSNFQGKVVTKESDESIDCKCLTLTALGILGTVGLACYSGYNSIAAEECTDAVISKSAYLCAGSLSLGIVTWHYILGYGVKDKKE